MRHYGKVGMWVFVAFGLVALLSACAVTPRPKPGEIFPCVKEGKLEMNVAKEAELKELSCFFKKWGGSETLHIKVAIKNICSAPQRFRVNIFLDDGKAVGGLIPRKTKKGLVKPGAVATFVYPVQNVLEPPKSMTIIIKTVGK